MIDYNTYYIWRTINWFHFDSSELRPLCKHPRSNHTKLLPDLFRKRSEKNPAASLNWFDVCSVCWKVWLCYRLQKKTGNFIFNKQYLYMLWHFSKQQTKRNCCVLFFNRYGFDNNLQICSETLSFHQEYHLSSATDSYLF